VFRCFLASRKGIWEFGICICWRLQTQCVLNSRCIGQQKFIYLLIIMSRHLELGASVKRDLCEAEDYPPTLRGNASVSLSCEVLQGETRVVVGVT
jgi:hypothetical protein